ncbi:hypothetical protein BB559_006176 [Furculomyces boomerangus]|uniref:YCII-related domain-containing protein n=2 Tax=Harpellales TaxID=61421 RepID=A0A2T9Y461_9FUNG|nr:hypothetical protein BB559_006176 [Furculomyces boomerangus]PWA03212.1 hypothetical protein BB558_000620 [Smittium angustum]
MNTITKFVSKTQSSRILKSNAFCSNKFFSTSSVKSQEASGKEYFVKIKDFTDPECLSRRLAIREKHLEANKQMIRDSKIKFATALLDENERMVGSVMVFGGLSEEEIRKILNEDWYTKSKVWDLSTLEISLAKILRV